MNLTRISLITSLYFAAPLIAAESHPQLPSVSAVRSARIVVECRHQQTPSLPVVAEVIGSNNASYVHNERELLMHFAQRECLRGVPYVAFVPDANATSPSFAMVSAPR